MNKKNDPQRRSVADALDAAANRLMKSKWIQEKYAVNKNGEIVGSRSEEAVGFCMIGAIRHEAIDENEARRVKGYIERNLCRDIPHMNDYKIKNKEEAVATLRKWARAHREEMAAKNK